MCLAFLFVDEETDPQMGSGTAQVTQMESGRGLELTGIGKWARPGGDMAEAFKRERAGEGWEPGGEQ